MGQIDETDLTGKLLISMPGLGDPNFDGSLVFVCQYGSEGAMGLIVNRVIDGLSFADIARPLEIEMDGEVALPVHSGGPVEPGRGFVLHSADWDGDGAALSVAPGLCLSATRDALQAIAGGDGPARRLLALGYSGWGPGQLEAEIRSNLWLVGSMRHGLVFDTEDARKWPAALKALGVDPQALSGMSGSA